eukprot:UN03483
MPGSFKKGGPLYSGNSTMMVFGREGGPSPSANMMSFMIPIDPFTSPYSHNRLALNIILAPITISCFEGIPHISSVFIFINLDSPILFPVCVCLEHILATFFPLECMEIKLYVSFSVFEKVILTASDVNFLLKGFDRTWGYWHEGLTFQKPYNFLTIRNLLLKL